MPQQEQKPSIFTLSQVTKSIERTILERYQSNYWVTAELHKLNHYRQSNHCYPELLEKKEGIVEAEMRAVLWKTDYLRINKRFIEVLGAPLGEGIKVLMLVKIQFNRKSGIQLQILDIDPTFTLGDLEREKQETIEKLKKEKLYIANKEKSLALVPQRIAVISAENSKGYKDFLEILENNTFGYKFFTYLFPAVLQGERSVSSIKEQLGKIRKVLSHFDCVAIIRGGGGEVGLTSFNNYELSKQITLFPLPVLTGIGHSTNETVTELVAFYNAITPTKTAEFLIQKYHEFAIPLDRSVQTLVAESRLLIESSNNGLLELKRLFHTQATEKIRFEKKDLQNTVEQLERSSTYFLREENRKLSGLKEDTVGLARQKVNQNSELLRHQKINLKLLLTHQFKKQEDRMVAFEKYVQLLDPKNILRRGYSITRFKNTALLDLSKININDEVETVLYHGTITSKITDKKSIDGKGN